MVDAYRGTERRARRPFALVIGWETQMQYITKKDRDDIGMLLVEAHDNAVRYRDKQQPHPKNGVDIKRCVAEARIGRTLELIKVVAPQLLKANSPNDKSERTRASRP